MKNRKILFIIVIVTIPIIVFLISFIMGRQVLSIFEDNEKQEYDINRNSLEKEKSFEAKEIRKDEDTKANETNSFEGIIISIDGGDIVVENPSHLVDYSIYESDTKWHHEHHVNDNGRLCVTASYMLCLDNTTIKDSNGKKISINDLNVGDTIKVYTKNVEYNVNTIFTPITADHIKMIEKK